MDSELTLEELSRRTGEPEERLRRWRSLGLIGREGAAGFAPEDVERVRLVQMLLRRGISLEAIAKAEREQQMLRRYLELLFPAGVGRRYSLAEASELLGLSADFLRRVAAAAGFADVELFERDVEALRVVKSLLDIGFPEEALIEGIRVYGDSLSRVAEMESRLFHFHIHGRLKAQGLRGRELLEATTKAGEQATPLIEPTLLFFHQLGWERAMLDDLVLHVAEEAGLIPEAELPGQLQVAVAFVDLSSFTPLTEAMGDAEAARVLQRFSALVRETAARWDGRVVKQIGDAFMLVFPDARSAVACTLEIEARASEEPQFPATRAGVHWGQVLYREGDYVGACVNIAARLAGEAERHQVLVTGAVRRGSKGLDGVEFVRLGKRRLKGITEGLELFETRPSGGKGQEKAVDPVCGMELGLAEIAARLSLEGTERAFCSEECLRLFVAAPERYQ